MDRRKKGEYVGALGALLVHVAVIALLILVSFTVPQPDEDAGGIPVMMGNVDAARGFDDPSLVDVDVLDEEAPAPAQTQPELPSEQDLLTQTEEETVTLKPFFRYGQFAQACLQCAGRRTCGGEHYRESCRTGCCNQH